MPISFRTSLALALFTTKIIEYLKKLGTVEIYASKGVQEVFNRHKLLIPRGLTQIDYAALPQDIKKSL